MNQRSARALPEPPHANTEPGARACCMASSCKTLRVRVCGDHCVRTAQPVEPTRARDRARVIIANRWIAAQQWLDLMENARELDNQAAAHGWKLLRRDPRHQIGAELPDNFLATVARLHDNLAGCGIEPTSAMAHLAATTSETVTMWMHLAHQRHVMATCPQSGGGETHATQQDIRPAMA